ncbi:MAG: hypothetical protein KC492_05520 [Myxococcales bacterium]|nr:hypothetical protein [Myxococcales bacterium]
MRDQGNHATVWVRGLLLLALACVAAPAVAGEPLPPESFAMLGSGTFAVLVAVAGALVIGTARRSVGALESRIASLESQQREQNAALQRTREEYARQEAFERLRDEVRGDIGRLREEMRADLGEVEKDLKQVLTLLSGGAR